jgi:hypothetical protein
VEDAQVLEAEGVAATPAGTRRSSPMRHCCRCGPVTRPSCRSSGNCAAGNAAREARPRSTWNFARVTKKRTGQFDKCRVCRAWKGAETWCGGRHCGRGSRRGSRASAAKTRSCRANSPILAAKTRCCACCAAWCASRLWRLWPRRRLGAFRRADALQPERLAHVAGSVNRRYGVGRNAGGVPTWWDTLTARPKSPSRASKLNEGEFR